MSDQKKRPAHEVILDHLRDLAGKYCEAAQLPEGIGRMAITSGLILCIGQLASVLACIEIPDHDREMVIWSILESARIANAVNTTTDKSEAADLLTQLATELQAA